jgi:hypothetical protein
VPVVSEKTRTELKEYAPDAAAALEALEAENARLAKLAEAHKPAPVAATFEPEVLPADLQDAVDEVPELAVWQQSPEHAKNWARAKAIDVGLSTHPDWEDKPAAERFAEVVRLRKLEVSKTASPAPQTSSPKPKQPTAEDAKRVIEERAKTAPISVGDLRGRAPPTAVTSKREAWKTMTNAEILASLPEE